jgi:hypothetical protein
MLKISAAIFGIAFGLGMSAILNPQIVLPPYLKTPLMAYLTLGIGVFGMVVFIVLMFRLFKEKIAIKSEINA